VINYSEKELEVKVLLSPVLGVYHYEKEYRVLVARHPDEQQLATWRRGVVLEDGFKTAPATVRLEGFKGKGAWLRVIMRQGRKRQIREIGSRLGLPVVKIIRTRISSLELGSLKPRQWRRLNPKEIEKLKKGQNETAR
jgi:23S rRNA pseudouridine2605 synthase